VKPPVVCDTNVLVSAFIAGGPPSRVLEAAIDGRIELVLADPVLAELERVLLVKLHFEQSRIDEIQRLLGGLAAERVTAPSQQPPAVISDRDDDLVLACAVAARAHVLVSGDRRHLLPVGVHEGLRVVSPQALLAALAKPGS
jgi:putative PIN family toxin of toxin-antitoxin system